MIYRSTSKRKQELIDKFLSTNLHVGERVSVKYSAVNTFIPKEKADATVSGTIMAVLPNQIKFKQDEYRDEKIVNISDIVSRNTWNIGFNPFEQRREHIRPIAYSLDSIVFTLNLMGDKRTGATKPYYEKGIEILEANWNPYVFDKDGNKQFYQRPFCWKLEDNQLLIESIYQHIDCGKILVRLRSFKEIEYLVARGETEVAFRDIVDGKQRLNAIRGFMKEEFPDMHGNYFGDLSSEAQNEFVNHQLLMYAEMPENTKDEDVIHQFLKLNFAGVPQSKEHIKFVKSLSTKI